MTHILLDRILPINLLLSTIVFYLAYRIYLRPRLREFTQEQILTPILLLHSLRHLGLMFIATGVTLPGLPQAFAIPAAFGDLLTAFLAMSSLFALRRKAKAGPFLLMLFNVVGFFDLVTAIATATITGAPQYMAAAYWIPAFWVPMLLITHGIVFGILRRRPFTVPSIEAWQGAAS